MQEIYERNNIHILQQEIDVGNTGHITNCYVVWDKKLNAVVIDPAYDSKNIINILKDNSLNLKAIFLTHCHVDHIAALTEIMNTFDVDIYGQTIDVQNINDGKVNCKDILGVELEKIDTTKFIHLNGGENITISEMKFEMLSAPGHTKGSMVFYEQSSNVLFTGDTIFERSYGRTDLESGSSNDMKNTLYYLFEKFKNENIECFSGHGNKFYLNNVKSEITLLFAFKR